MTASEMTGTDRPAGPLAAYLVTLAVLCAAFVAGARLLGERGMYLAQAYMLTPAVAAILTRSIFYKPGFHDANLRFGKARDYLAVWAAGLAITAVSFVLFTLSGAVSWDITGETFLNELAGALAARGQDMASSLPQGLTPRAMLLLFFVGGLTVFNILPGVVMGFGEEFGARGLMFPLMYRVAPWVGFLVGGLTWYAWHLPLALVIPHASADPWWQQVANHLLLASGSVCTAGYLAYVYVKSRSVWVTAVAHITLNNAARSLGYFVVIRSQLLANAALAATMFAVVAILYRAGALDAFDEYFEEDHNQGAGIAATHGE